MKLTKQRLREIIKEEIGKMEDPKEKLAIAKKKRDDAKAAFLALPMGADTREQWEELKRLTDEYGNMFYEVYPKPARERERVNRERERRGLKSFGETKMAHVRGKLK